MVSPSESLAIAELVVYPPILLANILVLVRHGVHRQSGWIFLTIFCILRTIGAGFGIAAAKKPFDINYIVWSAILGSIGIRPLLLATMGLLKRIIDETSDRAPRVEGSQRAWEKMIRYIPVVSPIYRILFSRATAVSHRSKVLQLLTIPATVALVLCIVGGVDRTSSSASSQKEGQSLVKAGLIIFLVIYAFLFVFGAKSVTEFNKVPVGEKRVLAAVLFALPLIGVRIAWSFIAYFGHGSTFSIISGSSMAIVVRAFMSLLEEFLVVIAYTIVGLLVPPAYGSQYDVEGQATGTQQPQGFYPLHQVGGPQVAPELPSYTYQRSGEPPGRQ